MRAFALLLLLAGCGSGTFEEHSNGAVRARTPPGAATPSAPPTEAELRVSRAAAAALTRYYDAIARGDYRAAFALREAAPGLTFARFAASFDRYADYRATIGEPSLPASQDGALWVSVPVQLYGRMRDGSSFGSVGRVTMKRGEAMREWKVVS